MCDEVEVIGNVIDSSGDPNLGITISAEDNEVEVMGNVIARGSTEDDN